MKLSVKKREFITDVISSLFVLLFIYAAGSKLLDLQKFEVQLGQSPVLAPFVRSVIWFIPSLEIATAGLLVQKKTQLFALYLSFSLMMVFTIYIIIILNFSPFIPCSCGGILQNMTWPQHLAFNIGFVLLACAGILVCPDRRSFAKEGEAENLDKSRQPYFK